MRGLVFSRLFRNGWIEGCRVLSSVRIPLLTPVVPIFLHMKFSESSVKFSRFRPSVVN